MSEFSLPIRVYIEDTDAGGIVYYVNYLKYFERARTEFMRTLGVDRAAISDNGWMFVVSKMSLYYRQPARLDDALSVTLVAQHVGAATIDFDQTVRRDHTLLVEGSVQIACVDRETGRPKRLEDELRAQLIKATQQQKVTG